eukprot:6570763-Ditylum_brightwellii.AAC.1
MEAMKIDLTITLRKELKTMVTELTKAAVKDVRAEMKDYMTNEIKSLISSIHTGWNSCGEHINSSPHKYGKHYVSSGLPGLAWSDLDWDFARQSVTQMGFEVT